MNIDDVERNQQTKCRWLEFDSDQIVRLCSDVRDSDVRSGDYAWRFLTQHPGLGQEWRNAHGKKEPWRYRWPDDFCDEVHVRLLEIGRTRPRSRTSPNPVRKGEDGNLKSGESDR
jgi:hypothetical protein